MSSTIDPNKYYRLPDIVDMMGICRARIYRMVAKGELPSWDRPYGPYTTGWWGTKLAGVIADLKLRSGPDAAQ